jgi:hypothetical protein
MGTGGDQVRTANRLFALGLATLALDLAVGPVILLVEVLRGERAADGVGWAAFVVVGVIVLGLVVAATRKWNRRGRVGTKLIALVPALALLGVDIWTVTELDVRGLFSLVSLTATALIVASLVLDVRAGGSRLAAEHRSRPSDGTDHPPPDTEALLGGPPASRQSEQPEITPSAAEAARRRLWK